MGMSYKLTKDLTLNTAVNNVLDKDFSEVKLYRWAVIAPTQVIIIRLHNPLPDT